MNLREAKKLLKNAGYIVEDKYMDDMDAELEEIVSKNKEKDVCDKDIDELKKVLKRRGMMLPDPNYAMGAFEFGLEYDDRYEIIFDCFHEEEDHGFKFMIYDNKLKKTVRLQNDEFIFFIDKQLSDKVNIGDVNKFIDTFIPNLIKSWENKNGFFKRLFKRS